MNDERDFTIGGVRHHTSRRDFEARLTAVEPEPVRKYYVEIGDRHFPVKQAVAVGLGIPRASFQSQEAFRILQTLGFTPTE